MIFYMPATLERTYKTLTIYGEPLRLNLSIQLHKRIAYINPELVWYSHTERLSDFELFKKE